MARSFYGVCAATQQAAEKEAALNVVLDLTPSSVLSIFEQALIDALLLNFKTVEHKGCYYHYSQAIWQKVQALGLQV